MHCQSKQNVNVATTGPKVNCSVYDICIIPHKKVVRHLITSMNYLYKNAFLWNI